MLSTQSQTQVNAVASSLALAATKEITLKQGWMLKKAGTGVFAQWKLKYLVLTVNLKNQPSLKVFDQCDQSKPPKYLIELKDAALELVPAKKDGVAVAAGAAGFGKKGFVPFIVYARQRKFYFAAQTKRDSDEWLAAIHPHTNQRSAEKGLRGTHQSHHQSHVQIQKPVQGHIQSSQSEAVLGSRGNLKSRSSSAFRRDDLDSKSISGIDDDAISVVSSVGSLLIEGDDGKSYSSSSFETLSFCSEPVLTQQELMAMGSNMVPSCKQAFNSNYLPSNSSNAAEKWNDRYQKILSLRPTNPEGVLQKDIQLLEVVGSFEEVACSTRYSNVPTNAPGAMFVDGMILHFACDYDVAKPDEVDAAISRTSSELRCIDAFNRAAHDAGVDINTALMVLIDYKGFRVVAYADMGIDEKTTALYDLKCNPLKCEESALGRLSQVGKELNLKTHGVQIGDDRRVNAHLSWTVQVHDDHEMGRKYAVNLFEVMPMDYYPGGGAISSGTTSPARSPVRQSSSTTSSPSKMMIPTPFQACSTYSSTISSDAFTSASGCGRKERELNDSECGRASRYLREVWIPDFVKHLDELEVRPLDSCQIGPELHKWGVNIRYLVMSAKFFDEKLRLEIYLKYEYDLDEKHFVSLHRPAIFAAMQHHCGVVYEEASDYNFSAPNPCPRNRLLSFIPRRKHPTGLKHLIHKTGPHVPNPHSQNNHHQQQQQQQQQTNNQPQNICQFNEDERLAYALTRHFRSMGPKSKLQRNDTTALHLTTVAAHYNATDRPEEAKRYGIAAISASTGKNTSTVSCIARAQLVEAMGAILVPSGSDRYNANMSGCGSVKESQQYDFSSILSVYRLGVSAVKWNWGMSHPMGMALHDRMSSVYVRCGKYSEALEFHNISLEIAVASFGKSHITTAGYLTKAGILLLYLQSTDEALARLNEALQIYRSLNAPTTYIAQVHSHIASALDLRGDSDGAISHAQKARKMWETARGQMDPRSVAANLHTANLLLKPFEGSSGTSANVLTPNIKAAYREAINCFEKVFRFLKNAGNGGLGTLSSSSGSSGVRSSGSSISSRASTISIDSYVSARTSRISSADSSNGSLAHPYIPLVGPAVVPPFSPLPQLPKSILHKLTKKIVTLKLALVESPRHREVIRTLRMGDASVGPVMMRGSEFVHPVVRNAFDPMMAREVVIKMAAVSPSIYLDGVLARIEDDDGSAIDELAIAIQLAESDTVGLAA
ncbi:hypothetical protein BDR26DRAFT_929090 [Obelidium mucronatum]|nr:hypothetical protein BDR26DRAFT_929090 [Obelidium mucronatum]